MARAVPKIWMVTGVHDRRWLSNAIENFERQTYTLKGLVLVANRGCVVSVDEVPPGTILLNSGPGPALPMNAGLDWLRKQAMLHDWFAKCDADDYYGPGYLASIVPAIDAGATYAGRSSLYVRTTANRLWFAQAASGAPIVFHGPTIAGRIDRALDFPLVNDWGEDTIWCLKMFAAGRTSMNLPPEHFCYQRWAGNEHAWPCSDDDLRMSWQVEFKDLGPFETGVVNGLKSRPEGVSLGIRGFEPENFMPLRRMREQLREKGAQFA